jgi:hypothetical protein
MLRNIFNKIGRLLEKVHYHEYPVKDESGKIIGYETITTRGTKVLFFPIKNPNNNEDLSTDSDDEGQR